MPMTPSTAVTLVIWDVSPSIKNNNPAFQQPEQGNHVLAASPLHEFATPATSGVQASLAKDFIEIEKEMDPRFRGDDGKCA
jgi:hypothetical protein